MNGDAGRHQKIAKPAAQIQKFDNQSASKAHWFSIPEPVRRVFDKFPLRSLEANNLPQRTDTSRNEHVLYIFTTSNDPSRFSWSCNPTCLKWQAYLLINNIPFIVKSANNHASPSGSLPFLIPSSRPNTISPNPIVASKLYRWVATDEQNADAGNITEAAYGALIDQNIRDAWLYHLYLDDNNFRSIAHPTYVASVTSNRLVQKVVARQLRAAAQEELFKSRSIIDAADIYESAGKAIRSLSLLLGTKQFFSSADRPGVFDASFFAYSHLLLDESLGWKTTTLQERLQDYPNLVNHRNTILTYCLNNQKT